MAKRYHQCDWDPQGTRCRRRSDVAVYIKGEQLPEANLCWEHAARFQAEHSRSPFELAVYTKEVSHA